MCIQNEERHDARRCGPPRSVFVDSVASRSRVRARSVRVSRWRRKARVVGRAGRERAQAGSLYAGPPGPSRGRRGHAARATADADRPDGPRGRAVRPAPRLTPPALPASLVANEFLNVTVRYLSPRAPRKIIPDE